MNETSFAVVVFTDLVDSTRLQNTLGDRDYEQFRRRHFQELREVVRRHAGIEIKNLGDGLMLRFESVSNALDCCIGMQRAVAASSLHERVGRYAIRVSLHAGEVNDFEDDMFGTPVVISQRLNQRTEADQILVSALIVQLVAGRDEYAFASVGETVLKGFDSSVEAFELGWKAANGRPAALVGPATSDLPFVGRDAELDDLRAAWQHTNSTGLNVITVSGEPGIGKSSLLRRFAHEVDDVGHPVLYGTCDADLQIPYQPFPQLLPTLTVGPTNSDDGGSRHEHLADGTTRSAKEDLLERVRLFDHAGQHLRELASPALLLIVDDLQWAGHGTGQMLLHMLETSRAHPILVVLGYRDTEVTPSSEFSELLAKIWRTVPARQIELRGLRHEAIAHLIAAGGADVDDRQASTFLERTDGNPLYVSELVRHARQGSAQGDEIPTSLKDIIRARVSGLADGAESVLTAASAIGSEFDLAVLARVVGRDETEVLDLVERSLANRLVVEFRDQLDRFGFSHALVREALLDGLSASRRARLHLSVAQAIEAMGVDRIDSSLSELANHYCAAGALDGDHAGPDYALRAGQRAMSALAFDEAAALADLASRSLDRVAADEPLRLWHTHMLRCAASMRLGDRLAADRAAAKATEVARSLDNPKYLLHAAIALSSATASVGIIEPRAVLALEGALNAIGSEVSEHRAIGLASLARTLLHSPDRSRAVDLANESVEIARATNDREVLAETLAAAMVVLWNPDNAGDRVAMSHEVIELADDEHRSELTRKASTTLFAAHLELGDIDAADEDLDRLEDLFDQHIPRSINWQTPLARGGQALRRGEVDEARNLADFAFEAATHTKDSRALPSINVLRFFLHSELGQLSATEQMCREQVQRFPLIPGYRTSLGAVMISAGQPDLARQEYEVVAHDDFNDLPRDANWLPSITLAASVGAALGDTRRARLLYDMLAPLSDRLVVAGRGYFAVGSVAHVLGQLAQCLGDQVEADQHYDAAADTAVRISAPTWLARARLDQAEMVNAGDPTRARDLALSALPIAQRFGMGTHLDRLEALAAQR